MKKPLNSSSISVAEIGSFSIGWHVRAVTGQPQKRISVARNGPDRLVNLNGDYVTGQCYVHFTQLDKPQSNCPVTFWHGGAMTGVTWETTPDGRPGWQMYFLRQGYDVYVCDAMERGRAGWSPYPEIYTESPIFRTLDEAWGLFRMGAREGYSRSIDKREPYDGLQFPLESFDQLGAQFVPRWTCHGTQSLVAYVEALRKIGPTLLVSHSQGANLALEAVQKYPELILGVVLIEPAAAPEHTLEGLMRASTVPHLFIWGDFIDQDPLWQQYRKMSDEYVKAIRGSGCHVDVIDLPKLGILGNSHVPMMDLNSDSIAEMVSDWFESNKSLFNLSRAV